MTKQLPMIIENKQGCKISRFFQYIIKGIIGIQFPEWFIIKLLNDGRLNIFSLYLNRIDK